MMSMALQYRIPVRHTDHVCIANKRDKYHSYAI